MHTDRGRGTGVSAPRRTLTSVRVRRGASRGWGKRTRTAGTWSRVRDEGILGFPRRTCSGPVWAKRAPAGALRRVVHGPWLDGVDRGTRVRGTAILGIPEGHLRDGVGKARPCGGAGLANDVRAVTDEDSPVRDGGNARGTWGGPTALCPARGRERGFSSADGALQRSGCGGGTVPEDRAGYRRARAAPATRHPPDDGATAPRSGSSSRDGRHRRPCASACPRVPRPPSRPHRPLRRPCAKRWRRTGRTPA